MALRINGSFSFPLQIDNNLTDSCCSTFDFFKLTSTLVRRGSASAMIRIARRRIARLSLKGVDRKVPLQGIALTWGKMYDPLTSLVRSLMRYQQVLTD